MNAKGIQIFIQEFFDIIRTLPQAPGKIIEVPRDKMPAPDTILDMRAYIDTGVQQALLQHNYKYLPSMSTNDFIYMLDLRHSYKEHENCIDEIAYSYDYDNDCVVETVVNTRFI